MQEIALHLLDIAQNSIAAGASVLDIEVAESGGQLTMTIADNGSGMEAEFLRRVTDPRTTTRTTRRVGMGLPLLKRVCERTGGQISIESAPRMGTRVTAVFILGHPECPPAGDLGETVALLAQGAPDVELHYRRAIDGRAFSFRTEEVRAVLDGISPGEPPVALWLMNSLREQEYAVKGEKQA